jgi:hypothetical protein
VLTISIQSPGVPPFELDLVDLDVGVGRLGRRRERRDAGDHQCRDAEKGQDRTTPGTVHGVPLQDEAAEPAVDEVCAAS